MKDTDLEQSPQLRPSTWRLTLARQELARTPHGDNRFSHFEDRGKPPRKDVPSSLRELPVSVKSQTEAVTLEGREEAHTDTAL